MSEEQGPPGVFNWITMSIPIHNDPEVGNPGEKPVNDVMKFTVLGIPPSTEPKHVCRLVMLGIERGFIKVEPGPRSIAFHEIEGLADSEAKEKT